jgi:hypothetical protein
MPPNKAYLAFSFKLILRSNLNGNVLDWTHYRLPW